MIFVVVVVVVILLNHFGRAAWVLRCHDLLDHSVTNQLSSQI